MEDKRKVENVKKFVFSYDNNKTRHNENIFVFPEKGLCKTNDIKIFSALFVLYGNDAFYIFIYF